MRRLVHEMRNQLAVAMANVEAFLDGKLEPTPARLRGVLEALGKLDALIDEVREGSDEMHSQLRDINVCDLICLETTAIEASAEEKGVALRSIQCAVSDPACAHFTGDPVRISQIVKNLLLNAIRYTPAGGSVTVDCRRSHGDLVFTVCDEGPGIAAGEAEHVFEAGYRGAASTGTAGSGMGLALVKRFVEEHGGSVLLSSGDGKGATFAVRLPGRFPGVEAMLPQVLDA